MNYSSVYRQQQWSYYKTLWYLFGVGMKEKELAHFTHCDLVDHVYMQKYPKRSILKQLFPVLLLMGFFV